MERNTLLSPQVWKEGLLEGVADNLCFGPGTFFSCHLARRGVGDRDSLGV